MPFQLKIKLFTIYYGDSITTTGNSLSDWNKMPVDNVQCVLLKYEDGKPEVFHRRDWYGMLENAHGLRFECDYNGNTEFADRCEKNNVKVAFTVQQDRYREIIDQAQKDRDA